MSYTKTFIQAIKKSELLSIELPNDFIIDSSMKLIDENFEKELKSMIKDLYPDVRIEDLSTKCVEVAYFLVPKIEEYISDRVLITFGQIEVGNSTIGTKMYYELTDKLISDMLVNKTYQTKANVHVWLTLPSMEIIDVTFASTVSEVQNEPEYAGFILSGKSDNFTNMVYTPILVGKDFLEKTNMIKHQ